MCPYNVKILQNAIEKNDYTLCVNRITALWALSESALGGILHAFRIPFSGLFICGAAVIFISMIAYISTEKWAVMKATLIVVLVKIIISPGTPLNAHLAVLIQGFVGQLLFVTKNHPKISSLALGIIASLYSVVQKIVVLTLVFGYTLWESIDQFVVFVIRQFYPSAQTNIKFSYWLIWIYISIHLVGGIIAGIIAGKLPVWISNLSLGIDLPKLQKVDDGFEEGGRSNGKIISKNKNKNSRKWWKRTSGILILMFSIGVAVLSYFFPSFGGNKVYEILIMIFRSVLIIFIWFTFVAPFVLKLFRKIIAGKKIIYAAEIDEVIGMFPQMKLIINECWSISATSKGFNRIKKFLSYSFVYLIREDLNSGETSRL